MDFKGHLEDDVFIFDKPERVNYYDLFEHCGKHGMILERDFEFEEEFCLCWGYATTREADFKLLDIIKSHNMTNYIAMHMGGNDNYGRLSI